MRIVIASREYKGVSPYSGGIGTFFALLAPALAKRGHLVDVITLAGEEAGTRRVEGVTVHAIVNRVPARLWYLGDLTWSLSVDRILRRIGETPDVLIAAEWGGDLAIHALRPRRAPIITQLTTSLEQIQALTAERPSRHLRIKYAMQRRLERLQAGRSDGILACSHAIMRWTRQLWALSAPTQTVIGNFTDVGRIRAARDAELPAGFPSMGPVILFVGRLEKRKGVHVLVEAMQSVWPRTADAQLVFLGQDHHWGQRRMTEHLHGLAGAFGDRLHFLGDNPAEHVFAAMRASDVVVFPSLWENFSLATLEARAQGAATVVTSGSGFDDFVHDEMDGLIVPPGNPEALAVAIERLLTDERLRLRLGAAAAAAEEVRPQAVLSEVEALIRQVSERGLPS